MAMHNVFIHIFPQYTLFFYILRGKKYIRLTEYYFI